MPSFALTLLAGIGAGAAASWSLSRLTRRGDAARKVCATDGGDLAGCPLFSRADVVKLLIDPESGQILAANPAAVGFYGFSEPRLLSMRIQDINMLSHEDVAAEMSLARDERRTFFHFQHQLAGGEVRDVDVYSGPIEVDGRVYLYSMIHDVTAREDLLRERDRLVQQLEHALQDVKTLRGLLPICASCKKVRNETDQWEQIEKYVTEHSEALFSHGLCPECAREAMLEAGLDPEQLPGD